VLTAGESITSKGGQYRAVMQSDGNFVEYGNGRALFSSGTSGAGNKFTYDYAGQVYVSAAGGALLWAVRGLTTQDPQAMLELTPRGELVSVDSTGQLWSNGAPGSATATHGTVLSSGQFLHAGVSELILQSDGNLVDYNGTRALWSSRTSGNPGDAFHVQSDGNLVVYSATGRPLWNSHTSGAGSSVALTLAPNGMLALAKAARVLWHVG
jgi:hypothetical protein